MVEYKEHHKSVLMFNCVKKTAHQNIYAIFFIQVQIIQIIPRSFQTLNIDNEMQGLRTHGKCKNR
jgi:hypothetical protein